MIKHFLLCTCLTTLALPAFAQDGAPRPALKPRVEGNIRAGHERTIAMSEFWVPLAQDEAAGSVVYGDARIMGDDDDNKEFNLGVGYRKIVTDVPVLGKGVAGINGWVDRRLTERGSTFHQITTGAEWHGDVYDIKANAYIPLNKEETHSSSSPQGTPYLAGSGIFYDIVNRKQIEEAQPGLDLELGLNVSGIVDGFADSARVYAGAYHFEGDKSDSVTGWRTRVAADITPDVQLGARFQRDDQRGSQGFLEATIRFPFGNKQSYKQHGLYARLDESPERDIDIVTGLAAGGPAAGTVETKPVLNATSGDAQRVLYVDNSAAGGGTGAIDNPFNTLAAAQAALSDNDVIYVARGDGTSTNMNSGFAINRSGVSLIGEGSAFVYDAGKFTTSTGTNFSGTLLKAAGLAPTLTNGNAGQDGILVTGANASISGFSITGAARDGLRVIGDASNLGTVRLSDIAVSNSGTQEIARGVYIMGINNATADDIVLNNVTSTGSGFQGLYIVTTTGAQFNNVILDTVTGEQSAGQGGVSVQAAGAGSKIANLQTRQVIGRDNTGTNGWGVRFAVSGGGEITSIVSDGMTATNNNLQGFRLESRDAGSVIGTVDMRNVQTSGNITASGIGMYALATMGGVIDNLTFRNSMASANNHTGVLVQSTGAGSAVNALTLSNMTSTNNTGVNGNGFRVLASASGVIGNATLTNLTATGNAANGIYLHGQNDAQMTASVQNSIASTNANHGVAVYDDTSGTFEVDLGGGGRSAGRNVLAGNTLEDLALDYDGRTISAMGNWWGQASGPDQDTPNIGIRPQIYYGAAINDGLVGHWTFDTEWVGTTMAYDRSGYNHHAQMHGDLDPGDLVQGEKRQALRFNDVNEYMQIPYSAVLNSTDNISVSAIVNRMEGPDGQWQPIYQASGNLNNNTGFYFGFRSSSNIFENRAADGTSSYGTNVTVATLNTPLHMTGVYSIDANFRGTYLDGVLMANNTASAPIAYAAGLPIRIGALAYCCVSTATPHLFDGTIDDLRVYNRALTVSEIGELYRMDTSSVVNFGGFMTTAP